MPNRSVSLTELAKRALAVAARRAATSESNVIELLVRRYGHDVGSRDFEQFNDGGA